MTTAVFRTTSHTHHDEPRHVEQAARLFAVEQALEASGLMVLAQVAVARPAHERDIRAVHAPRVIETLQYISLEGEAWIDNDTYVMMGSWDAAQQSAGAAVDVVDAVVNGQATNAFALTRPPGHHATPRRSMGFCLLNNVAIAARYATNVLGLERVAIVDYDVHHGNGTQDTFYADNRVLFCSSHGAPLYPGSGDADEIGSGPGYGTTLNAPMPYNVGDSGYTTLYREVMIPALRRFQPQLILVSAGFDAHWDDPIGPHALTINGFSALTQMLRDAADELCDGRLALVMEGGYSLRALAAGASAALGVLLGLPQPDSLGPAPTTEPNIQPLINGLKKQHPLLQP